MDDTTIHCFVDGARLREIYPTTVAHTLALECGECSATFVYDQSKKSETSSTSTPLPTR